MDMSRLRRRGSRLVAVLLAALLAPVAAVGPPAQASVTTTERVTLTATSTVTIAGRGFGHGIGMSQYGARAAAAAGSTYRQILDFYYPGTTATTQASTELRVLLKSDSDDDLRVVAAPGMVMSDARGVATPIGFSGATVSQWRVLRNANDTGFVLFGLVGSTWRLWSQSASPGFIALSTSPATTVQVVLPDGSRREYRGSVRAVADGAAPGLASVNAVRMEDYLRSVVPAEMPSSWPANALRAQAVAARTYASQNRASRPAGAWHTCDDTACQVYKGVRTLSAAGAVTPHEAAATDAAVSATSGVTLYYGGTPAFTQFSASNGGWTAAGSAPYLVAKRDPWDAQGNPVHAWSVRITAAQLRSAYPVIGTPRSLTVVSRTGPGEWGGRVESVVLAGSTGSTTVTGAAFRTAFGLRSAWWKVTGTSRLEPDTTADGRPDLTARTPGGALMSYEGDRSGGFATTARRIGTGWQVMRLVTDGADLDGDGNGDVLAIDDGGVLWFYPSNRAGGLGARHQVGTGWQVMSFLATPGDMTGDGRADLLAVDRAGTLWLYPGDGAGRVTARRAIGTGWHVMTAVLGAGDMDGDGTADVVARDSAGRLLLYRGRGDSTVRGAVVIGNGWQSMRMLTVHGDWSGDGRPDVLASDGSGALYLYPWNGSAFSARRTIGQGWTVYDRLL